MKFKRWWLYRFPETLQSAIRSGARAKFGFHSWIGLDRSVSPFEASSSRTASPNSTISPGDAGGVEIADIRCGCVSSDMVQGLLAVGGGSVTLFVVSEETPNSALGYSSAMDSRHSTFTLRTENCDMICETDQAGEGGRKFSRRVVRAVLRRRTRAGNVALAARTELERAPERPGEKCGRHAWRLGFAPFRVWR